MKKNGQLNEVFITDLTFGILGDILGDYLLSLEVKIIGKNRDKLYIKKVNAFFDKYQNNLI